MKHIVVIGGGIAGLAAAHHVVELRKELSLDSEVTLLEASDRLGGTIATERVGEFLLEAGPDSFITEKPQALMLCQRLGLTPRLVSTISDNQKIYIVRGGKLKPLPEGFFLLAPTRFLPFLKTPLFSWGGKLRMAAELFLPRRRADGDESLGSFVRRRFGDEALERVAQPLVGGIYASDPDRLSLSATMPRFKEMEREHRSVIYAMWAAQRARAGARQAGSGARWSLFVTLANGLEELVGALAQRLPESAVRLRSGAKSLTRNFANTNWEITLENDEVLSADAVILATPAYRAGEILRLTSNDASRELAQLSYASTAIISLAYRSADFPQVPKSFGFVVPVAEKRKIMACTFSSLKYPGRAPADHILLRAFVGGTLQAELYRQNDSAIEIDVRDEIASLLRVTAVPVLSRVWRHPNSMPQYNIGHDERVKKIEGALANFPTLALAGSAYHGVGISDCVRTGEEAAQKVVEQLSKS
ncbi:MAG: protoporphyrinogen oxidase [Deltaproteobacteria bacterium]|nr:protoporphyrinogen oxidase [Deltaproteobacteria bacterium]